MSDGTQKNQAQYMIAIEDFAAKDVSQLSFKKGDTIKVITKFPTGWFSGELDGKIGFAPQKCVKTADEEIPETQPKKSKSTVSKSNKSRERLRAATVNEKTSESFREEIKRMREEMEEGTLAIAMYDYKSDGEGQLTFKSGQELIVLKKMSNGWWKGKIRDEVGFFPGGYVKELNDGDEGDVELKKGVVLYPYTAQSSGEITLSPGDEVLIYPDDLTSSMGWSKCTLASNRSIIGHFPSSYIQIIEETTSVNNTDKSNHLKVDQPKKSKRKSDRSTKPNGNDLRKSTTTPEIKVEDPIVRNKPPQRPPPSVPPKKPNPLSSPKQSTLPRHPTTTNSNTQTQNTNPLPTHTPVVITQENLDVKNGQTSESDQIEKLKQAMIKLQQQSKIAFEEVLGRLDEGEKERANLEFVMRDMKLSAKEDKALIVKLEHQNKLLYDECKSLTALLQKEISSRNKMEDRLRYLEVEFKKM